jgi:hypothetical protein
MRHLCRAANGVGDGATRFRFRFRFRSRMKKKSVSVFRHGVTIFPVRFPAS